jgi:hypothetical protein
VNEAGRRPKLVAVPGGEAGEGPGPRTADAAPTPPRRLWLPLLLGVALALCAAAFAAQARRAEQLAVRLAAVEASLVRAEARLAAWGAWRGEVRSRADRLRADLGELDAALAVDPGEGTPRE